MSEARSDFRPGPALPAVPRRVRSVSRSGAVDGRTRTIEPPPSVEAPYPPYPLDPPLEDVRIPVKAPHATATAYSRAALMHRFPNAEAGDDLHMLFTEPSAGKDPSAGKEPSAVKAPSAGKNKTGQSRLSPDVLVALDVPRRSTRADYDADLLGPPSFVLEVLSRSTWKHDIGRKLDCYQQVGVRECLLFDVTGEDLAGVGKDLWGFALTPECRKPLDECVLPNGQRGVRSEVLGLIAYIAKRTPPSAPRETWALTMRWHDPATAEDIPDYDESRAEAQAERTRAEAAERKIAELEEQIRLRNGAK